MRLGNRIAGILAACLAAAGARAEPSPIVFAAASLTGAFEEIAKLYLEQSGVAVRFSFAASSTLARQIEEGAKADIFASADERWMDYLAERGLILAETRVNPIGNRLVLIAPADGGGAVRIGPGLDLIGLLGDGRLATGDPAHVPVGRYAQQALESLGLWAAAEPRLARADNARAALALVERGEAALGIVYATDAALAQVRVIGVFPEESHAPILYPMAMVSGAAGPAARAFFAFLAGPEARGVFRRHGFLVP